MANKKKSGPRTSDIAALEELGRDELSVFLYIAFTGKELLSILKKLGVEYPGHRLEGLGDVARADLLADEVRAAEDAREETMALLREFYKGPALEKVPLDPDLAGELAVVAVREDSIVRLLWRVLSDPSADVRKAARPALAAIVKLYYGDPDAEPAPKAEKGKGASKASPAAAGDGTGSGTGGDAAARRELERAERNVRQAKERESELKDDLKSFRAEVSEAQRKLAAVSAEKDALAKALAKSEEALREAKSGKGKDKGTEKFEAAQERLATLTAERDALKKERDALRAKVDEPAAAAPAAAAAPEEDEPDDVPTSWSNPRFTKEFYDSLVKWDARLQRFAFKKAFLLAENHRHPSLRAIQLEGIPGWYRVRVASDVRMIYRRTEDGGVEILSVIDREDLDRYIRQAKTR